MKVALTLIGIAFAVSLAIVVGNKLAQEAQALVIGAMCGIAASVPVTIGLAMASMWQPPKPPESQYPLRREPRIVIIPNRYDENGLMVRRGRDD